jgi:hypothetical protein
MSRHTVAKLWGELVNRNDLSFIVRECLGRMWPLVARETKEVDEDRLLDIVLLKQLFDLQRTVLRKTPPGLHVLPPDVLLDALDCISRTAAIIAKSQDLPVRRATLEILRAALISGFRVALLALGQQTLEHAWLLRLQDRVNWWITCECVDETWTSQLLKRTLNDLRESEQNDMQGTDCKEHLVLDVPDRPGVSSMASMRNAL